MAKRARIELVDDMDGEELADETVEFGLDGIDYEIDLSEHNAEQLRADLSRWIEHARQCKRRAMPRHVPRQEVREWARRKGYAVPASGRLSGELLAEFEREHGAVGADQSRRR
ncbi:histone-like nucleoid-structuring protein Lsr2 [Mycobacteroides chelonae]|jgi:ribosomal protein S3|uniref:histone-like nucleoid-structuring protein Lsr2 n=1 Tax=Mycobacteroides chelonae TaxID=1774 RepID=UPI0009928867|nr:Lsr2 family protein [Mycobacteroides chelonae]